VQLAKMLTKRGIPKSFIEMPGLRQRKKRHLTDLPASLLHLLLIQHSEEEACSAIQTAVGHLAQQWLHQAGARKTLLVLELDLTFRQLQVITLFDT
jgi:hypothetical protein